MRSYLLTLAVVLFTVSAVACGGNSRVSPTAVPVQTVAPITQAFGTIPAAQSEFERQTNDNGAVTVQVTPLVLGPGAQPIFDLAMNTHSVELDANMLQVVLLRDDAGKEYAPVAWDGPGAGGHHREGKLTFPVLESSARSVTLLVRNIAGVPERAFTWKLNK